MIKTTKATKIIEQWEKGEKQIDIAFTLGVTEGYVSQVLAPEKKKKKDEKKKVKEYSGIRDFSEINTLQKLRDQKPKNSPEKEILIKYMLALNRGRKTYLKYGFKDNHEFLGEIIKIINDI